MKSRILAILMLTFVMNLYADSEQEYFRSNGGMMILKGKGIVSIIDCRAKNRADDFITSINKIKDTFGIAVLPQKGNSFTFTNALNQMASLRSNAAVFLIEDDILPMTLCSSEENWSVVNVQKLKADNPSNHLLKKRINTLIVRQCCRALGSDETKSTNCCFRTIQSISDLDNINSLDVTVNPYLSISEVLSLRGIEPFEYGTYLDACEAGIAPPPTNDIQKAIWDKVHAAPKNPMKIEFDPKKGR